MKKFFFIISIFIFLFPAGVLADFYPDDAKTIYTELIGPSDYRLLPAGDKTILGVSIQQSGTASISWVSCGTIIFIQNYGKDFPFNAINYYCQDILKVEKTGQDNASFVITYVDYNIASTTPAYATTTPYFMPQNIENIGYTATTTITGPGVSITQGTYVLPNNLFLFVVILLVLTISTILILLHFKRK